MSKSYQSSHRSLYSIKVQRSLYELKQSGCIWYNHLSEYLIKEGCVNDSICQYIFIKQLKYDIAIVAIYIDNLNLIGTPEELQKSSDCLKNEFEMKIFGKLSIVSSCKSSIDLMVSLSIS